MPYLVIVFDEVMKKQSQHLSNFMHIQFYFIALGLKLSHLLFTMDKILYNPITIKQSENSLNYSFVHSNNIQNLKHKASVINSISNCPDISIIERIYTRSSLFLLTLHEFLFKFNPKVLTFAL